MAWRWTDPEETIATDDEGTFAPAGAPVLQAFVAGVANPDFDPEDEGSGPQWFVEPGVIAPYQRYASLADAQDARLAELADRRWRAEQDGFSFGGAPLKLDDGTQRRIAGAIQYLQLPGAPASVQWQVVRGTFITLTLSQLEALGAAAGAHVQACFANVATLSAAILAASTIEAVEAVDLEQGWPG